jgi:hypothetical protein
MFTGQCDRLPPSQASSPNVPNYTECPDITCMPVKPPERKKSRLDTPTDMWPISVYIDKTPEYHIPSLFWHVYVLQPSYFVWSCSPHIHRTEFVTSHNEQKTKSIKCGGFNYSIVVNAHRVTSMADINTDAVRKQKKAEYNKQYRLKRKLLLQQQVSKDIYMIRYFHP